MLGMTVDDGNGNGDGDPVQRGRIREFACRADEDLPFAQTGCPEETAYVESDKTE
ncbi:hypothetical protein BGZ99_009656, partial [Dissophora globulifera]